ncbi:ABC transporter permease [Bifidobacterium aquikefiri]|uniref:ABC transporter n=1 Tax=Bifidobacterium aquikefiri TaxID=1653207 RepID=A0A261G6N6_9BIFI|nr:ABC transporter permease [Bifidobacterium aquikefiri]OZG67089.1 ABC transporter [Bifidobacterium aquikefiri]
MRALIIKEFQELLKDRRTLAMLIVMPVLLLIIFGYAANFSVSKVSVTVIGSQAESLSRSIRSMSTARDNMDIVSVDSTKSGKTDAQAILRSQSSDVVIQSTESDSKSPLSERMKVYVDGSQLFTAQAAKKTVLQLVAQDAQTRITQVKNKISNLKEQAAKGTQELQDYVAKLQAWRVALSSSIAQGKSQIPAVPTPPTLPKSISIPSISMPSLTDDNLVTVMFNPDLDTSWVMIPGLIGLILTLIGTVITSIGLVRERETGTLEQLAVMPIRPGSIIMGKIVPYFVLAIVDMLIVTVLARWLFNVPFIGNVGIFILAVFMFLFVVLGLGVLISTLSQTSGQAIQMALMITMPQILLSGIIFPLKSMAVVIRWIGYVLPLTWFNKVSQGVMLRGASFQDLWMPLVILAIEAVVIFGFATMRMRFILTHGGAR